MPFTIFSSFVWFKTSITRQALSIAYVPYSHWHTRKGRGVIISACLVWLAIRFLMWQGMEKFDAFFISFRSVFLQLSLSLSFFSLSTFLFTFFLWFFKFWSGQDGECRKQTSFHVNNLWKLPLAIEVQSIYPSNNLNPLQKRKKKRKKTVHLLFLLGTTALFRFYFFPFTCCYAM